MVLIYKIQRGTVDLTTNELAQILTEAKSQLAIFEVLTHSFTDSLTHSLTDCVCAVHISYVVSSTINADNSTEFVTDMPTLAIDHSCSFH